MDEDYIPLDPTNIATVRVGDELLRCVPGLTERPIADVSRSLRFATAVDDRLLRKHKFGIVNVVRVSLRYVDYCLNSLLPAWDPAPDIALGDDIDLPEKELDAARKLVSTNPLESLRLDESDLMALEWMTSPAASAKYNNESPTSPFGRTLRYRSSIPTQLDRWLPPTYVPEVLAHAVSELIDGLEQDNNARRSLRFSIIDATRRALWRFSNTLIESPPQASDEIRPLTGNEIQWLVPVDGPNFLAVSMLFTEDLPQTVSSEPACVTFAKRVHDHDPAKGRISMPMAGGGKVTLLPGATIVPLVIIAGTSSLTVPQFSGQATLALEDLTWISETATADDDLYSFAHDLSSPDMPQSIGFEAINYWEYWKTNDKAFFKGGISPTLLVFEPHAGENEWKRAVALSPLEVALKGTGLPPLRLAEMAEISSDHIASIAFLESESQYDYQQGTHHAPNRIYWSLPLITPPIAIVRSSPDWPNGQKYKFLFDLCGGLVFAFEAIGQSWRHVHQDPRLPGYRLWLQDAETDDSSVNEVVQFSAPFNQVGNAPHPALWSVDIEGFVQKAEGDPHAPNVLTADVFKQLLEYGGVERRLAEKIGDEWLTSRAFLIVETTTARTKLNHLPKPWPLDSSDVSATATSFARRLHSAGIRPGEYHGDAANDLVKTYLAPEALEELNGLIFEHNIETIVATGLEQLNRVYDHIQEEQVNLARVLQNLSTTWDPVARMAELANETLNLRQCNEIIVEAALRGNGQIDARQPVTPRSWSALLAAAEAYRTMTTLSERLHFQVAPATIEIDTTYELTFKDDENTTDDSWILEGESLNTDTANLRLGPAPDDDDVSASDFHDDVDAAMLASLGASSSDLFTTLVALAQWESFDEDQTVALTSEDEALNCVYLAAGDPDEEKRSRLRQAFQMLTVSADILQSSSWEPWQTRTRRHRLLVQPLVRRGDGMILIAPQYLLTTLSVYDNQLKQGVLPWTGEVPKQVSRALAQRRAQRNLAFERTLQLQLEELGFKTISRVKPGQQARLGVPKITTEIDLVCGRNGDPNIWPIEAKDPVSVYGYAETARELRKFYMDSKAKGRIKPCYATQLSRKESELKPYVEDIARTLGVTPPPDHNPHALHTLFVTRNVTPAGYWISRPYRVLTETQLLATLGKKAARHSSGPTQN